MKSLSAAIFRHRVLMVATVLVLACSAASHAQAPGVKATPLLRAALTGDHAHEAVVANVVFAVGATTGRHSHPGDEYATVLEGELELRVDGQPARRVRAGEAYHNARGAIHETLNVGGVPARAVSTFIIDRDAALVIPAP